MGTPIEQDTTASENTENQESITETNSAPEEEQGQDEDTIRVMALDNEQEIPENTEAEQEQESQELFY